MNMRYVFQIKILPYEAPKGGAVFSAFFESFKCSIAISACKVYNEYKYETGRKAA